MIWRDLFRFIFACTHICLILVSDKFKYPLAIDVYIIWQHSWSKMNGHHACFWLRCRRGFCLRKEKQWWNIVSLCWNNIFSAFAARALVFSNPIAIIFMLPDAWYMLIGLVALFPVAVRETNKVSINATKLAAVSSHWLM